MTALDTNVWLYCHDARDARKRAVALQLVAGTRPLALPWQVGCEFVAAGRKLAAAGFTEAQAWASLTQMRAPADAVVPPAPDDWDEARALQGRHVLSFWDALLVAACLRGGVTVHRGHGCATSDRRTFAGESLPPRPRAVTTAS